MSISLAVTAHNETQRGGGDWLLECIEPAMSHSFVDDILVVDDGSEDWLDTAARLPKHPKLRFQHLSKNRSVFGAKIVSIANALGEWVQYCDSDNVMDADYFDCLSDSLDRLRRDFREWSPTSYVWLQPSFAKPVFDYRAFATPVTEAYSLSGFAKQANKPGFECLANTSNWCVHGERFRRYFRGLGLACVNPHTYFSNWLNVAQPDSEEYRQTFNALDSFILNKRWLECGGMIWVVPGLEYDHRVTGKIQDSNYNRAPEAKERLGKWLLNDLVRRAECADTVSSQ